MMKQIKRFAAAFAACAVTLMQFPAIMPTISAVDSNDFMDEFFDPTDPDNPNHHTLPHAETTAATTIPTATNTAATTAVTTTFTTTSTTATTTSATSTQTTPPPASTTTSSTATTVMTSSTTTTAATPAAASSTTTSAPEEDSLTLKMPEDPDMPDFSYLGAIGNLTAEQTEFLARSIFKCCKNPDAYPHEMVNGVEGKRRYITLEISGLELFLADEANRQKTIRSMEQVIDTVTYNHRECLLADLDHSYNRMGATPLVKEHFCGIFLSFKASDAMYKNTYNQVQEAFDAISSLADPEWNDAEKALFFHDYLSIHYNYDFDSANAENDGDLCHYAYGILTQKKGVCQAYAWLYNLLLNENGVESYIVVANVPDPSDPSGEMLILNHAWNLVKVDGNWYHADVTFDDQGYGIQREFDPSRPEYADLKGDRGLGFAGQIDREHFLVSTNELLCSSTGQYVGGPDDWLLTNGQSAYRMATSNLPEASFWKDSQSVIQPYLNGWLVKKYPPDFNINSGQRTLRGEYFLYTRKSADTPYDEYDCTQLFVEETQWGWRASTDPKRTSIFKINNYSTYCLDGDIAFYTSDAGKGLHYVFCKDTSNMAASMVDNFLFNGNEYGVADDDCIFGMTIEDDTLRLFTARTLNEPPYEVDIPMSIVRERLNLTTSETLPSKEEPTVSTVAGDFSGDGSLDVVDVVNMTKYMLSPADHPTDADTRQRMDLVPDGIIDVFDLGKLKWMLLHKK